MVVLTTGHTATTGVLAVLANATVTGRHMTSGFSCLRETGRHLVGGAELDKTGLSGWRYFHKTNQQFWKPTINLDKLWTLVPAEKREAYLSGQKTDTAPVIDLLPLGYSKVLGKGRVPEIPIVVRARYFSRDAEQKIKEAGGVVELVA